MSKIKLPELRLTKETFTDEMLDKFAIGALPALIGPYNEGVLTKNDLAREAYRIAYAMLLAKIELKEQTTCEKE